MSEFPDGVAVVIGGSGGIGAACCEELARAGSDIAITYRNNEAAATRAADAVRALGRAASVHALDLSDPAAVDALFGSLGPIHTVVHAAGASIPMKFISELELATWRAVIDADVHGFFHVARAAIPALRQTKGSIVAITSIGLERFPARDILSVAPKAAIHQLIRGIAKEEGRHGVRANTVALGVIEAGMFLRLRDTDFSTEWLTAARDNTALKRFGTAAEVAHAVTFLASSRAAYLTGQTLNLDGGHSL